MKKKRSTGKVLLIGAGVLGAAYAIYEFVIKPRQTGAGSPETLPPGFDSGSGAALAPGTNLINSADNLPVNQAPILSPIGTPDSQLQYNIVLKKGDKGGEVQKLQKISNVVSKIYSTSQLQNDGVFGNLTLDKISKQFGKTTITLNNALKFMRAIEAWNKFGRKGKWTQYIQ
jgi:hypothetical protein